jgi:hypothetical protein
MPFYIDGQLSETWTWRPSQTGWVEQQLEGTNSRLQITWARKASVAMIEIWCDESGPAPRWVCRWKDANGEVQDKVLNAKDPTEAEEEAESFIYRMAYL